VVESDVELREMTVNRRKFLQTTGLTLGAGSLSNLLAANTLAQSKAAVSVPRTFPASFLWGSATASYQVEGAVREGGRGPSVWDTFSHTAGKTFNGDTGDVADDFYHLYPDDIKLMKNLGLRTFRFSVAWSRIFPKGTGQPNIQGVDFYKRMVDALLAAGIEPYCTLFHWDLPQALQDVGGWENRDTAKAFADYAGYTAGVLSDRVHHFMTMNEMRSFVELGYGTGLHAPGLQVGPKRLAQLNHFVALAHGMSVQAIRASAKSGTKVGIADNVAAATPVIETPEHIAAARRAMREENAMFLTVVEEGRYTDLYLKRLGENAPKFTAEEMAIIKSPMDFVGINIYQPTYIRADGSEKGYAVVEPPASYPHMYSPWLYVGPEALYWAPKLVSEIWNVKEMYITENGASSTDEIAPDGHVYDTDRVMYLRNYLTQLHRAVSEGIPVRGYFLWSLLDNYEWADGYGKRFGIVHVDFKTQKRVLKLSANFYREVIARNGLA
jgi:beta-glucosidase